MKKKIILSSFFLCIIFGMIGFFLVKEEAYTPLVKVNSDQIDTILEKNNNDEWIYVGRPSCPECEQFTPILMDHLEKKHDNLYYYNIDEIRESKDTELINTLDQLHVKLIPSLVHIKNGKAVKVTVGIKSDKELNKLSF